MDRSQKTDAVAALNAVFNEVGVVVVTRNLGLTVAQSSVLRGKIRDAGGTYKVAKNSLAKLAAAGTPYDVIGDTLTGPTALAWSVDPVAAAKAVVDFAKTNDKIEIVGGAIGGVLLDANGIKALNCAPSLSALFRLRRPSWPSSPPLRRRNWPACSAHMPPRTLRKTFKPSFSGGRSGLPVNPMWRLYHG